MPRMPFARPAVLLSALLGAGLVTGPVASASVTTISPESVSASAAPAPRSSVQPLERAHAHNDYEHERPLLDAIDHGFTSAEADVWLVDGELYIGHDGPDLSRTLADTYLEPLAQRFRENGGAIHPQWRDDFRLLIDVKSNGAAAWPVIDRQLAAYPQLFSASRQGRVHERAVTAVISGNRDLAAMQAATTRFSFYDGRMSDLGGPLDAGIVPLISDNWTKFFTWQGVGEMPAGERARLHEIVATAHANGQEVRFWATPDLALPNREALWRELVAADVDVLNTDDLAGLQRFLLAEDPAEQSAARAA
ncbi:MULTISPECIES: phosphatidylinositol-specific phospholipase C/glycerophosphodiester phosphodiesterase family protein [unclassified Knoellia]|uniref:phosphatidylinositol-specific phospholipase C/glycerophosphodiester phosphodiesterase family protein n=1 Tax=Knoellia altitudinis TaxID=3404795 RepID=UPI003610518D